jgi:hypothetical protein
MLANGWIHSPSFTKHSDFQRNGHRNVRGPLLPHQFFISYLKSGINANIKPREVKALFGLA